MDCKNIYILKASSGSYDDYRAWSIKAYLNEDVAKLACDIVNKELEDLKQRNINNANMCNSCTRDECEDCEFEFDYYLDDQHLYYIETVPFAQQEEIAEMINHQLEIEWITKRIISADSEDNVDTPSEEFDEMIEDAIRMKS